MKRELIVSLIIISVLAFFGADYWTTYCVSVVAQDYESSLLPPSLKYVLVLRNDGIFPVKVQIRATITLVDELDKHYEKTMFFDPVTIEPFWGESKTTASISLLDIFMYSSLSISKVYWRMDIRSIVSSRVSEEVIEY